MPRITQVVAYERRDIARINMIYGSRLIRD